MPYPRSYYPIDENFLNSAYALHIGAEYHFANMLLEGDLTRIIYSETDFALRKWAEKNEGNLTNLPFMNYKIKPGGYEPRGDRPWFNHAGNLGGIYIPELKKKINFHPITFKYDCTLWVHQDVDLHYVFYNLVWDDSNKTIVEYDLIVDSCPVKMPAVLGYNFDWDSRFTNQDWLEKNKIRAITVDFEFQTFQIKISDEIINLSKEIVIDFVSQKIPNVSEKIEYEQARNNINSYFLS